MWFSFRPVDSLRLDPDDGGRKRVTKGPEGVGKFGMQLFLASLTFIFGATMLLYVVLMRTQETPVLGVLPVVGTGLAVSTVLLLASSVTLWVATRAIRRDDRDGLARWLGWTLGLGLAFVVSQSWVWWTLVRAGLSLDSTNRHAALFVVLTVLHALHVFGGIVRLVQVTVRARSRRYAADDHEPVTNMALYWHFLDLVWIVMLGTILGLSS